MPDSVGSRHEHFYQDKEIILHNSTHGLYILNILSQQQQNTFNLNIRKCEHFPLFKKQIRTQNSRFPMYYYVRYRLGQILHAGLRTDSSSSNSRLFLRNLVFFLSLFYFPPFSYLFIFYRVCQFLYLSMIIVK